MNLVIPENKRRFPYHHGGNMHHRLILCVCALLCLSTLCSCDVKKSDVTLGNVMILGDSYSTFEGCIPEGYPSYYSKKSVNLGVTKQKHTWWAQVINQTDAKLILNSSYSGSTVCHTGYDGADASSYSFLGRMQALCQQGFFEKTSIDTLIIYGGLNDYWAGAPRGEIRYEALTDSDAYSVYPAFIMLFTAAREALPEARIIFILEEYLDEEMKNSLREICSHFEIETVEMHGISKGSGHPDKTGMTQTADQIISDLEKNKP